MRCQTNHPDRGQCYRHAGHTGLHRDADAREWAEVDETVRELQGEVVTYRLRIAALELRVEMLEEESRSLALRVKLIEARIEALEGGR